MASRRKSTKKSKLETVKERDSDSVARLSSKRRKSGDRKSSVKKKSSTKKSSSRGSKKASRKGSKKSSVTRKSSTKKDSVRSSASDVGGSQSRRNSDDSDLSPEEHALVKRAPPSSKSGSVGYDEYPISLGDTGDFHVFPERLKKDSFMSGSSKTSIAPPRLSGSRGGSVGAAAFGPAASAVAPSGSFSAARMSYNPAATTGSLSAAVPRQSTIGATPSGSFSAPRPSSAVAAAPSGSFSAQRSSYTAASLATPLMVSGSMAAQGTPSDSEPRASATPSMSFASGDYSRPYALNASPRLSSAGRTVESTTVTRISSPLSPDTPKSSAAASKVVASESMAESSPEREPKPSGTGKKSGKASSVSGGKKSGSKGKGGKKSGSKAKKGSGKKSSASEPPKKSGGSKKGSKKSGTKKSGSKKSGKPSKGGSKKGSSKKKSASKKSARSSSESPRASKKSSASAASDEKESGGSANFDMDVFDQVRQKYEAEHGKIPDEEMRKSSDAGAKKVSYMTPDDEMRRGSQWYSTPTGEPVEVTTQERRSTQRYADESGNEEYEPFEVVQVRKSTRTYLDEGLTQPVEEMEMRKSTKKYVNPAGSQLFEVQLRKSTRRSKQSSDAVPPRPSSASEAPKPSTAESGESVSEKPRASSAGGEAGKKKSAKGSKKSSGGKKGSKASGKGSKASGKGSKASGKGSKASGKGSKASGKGSKASGKGSKKGTKSGSKKGSKGGSKTAKASKTESPGDSPKKSSVEKGDGDGPKASGAKKSSTGGKKSSAAKGSKSRSKSKEKDSGFFSRLFGGSKTSKGGKKSSAKKSGGKKSSASRKSTASSKKSTSETSAAKVSDATATPAPSLTPAPSVTPDIPLRESTGVCGDDLRVARKSAQEATIRAQSAESELVRLRSMSSGSAGTCVTCSSSYSRKSESNANAVPEMHHKIMLKLSEIQAVRSEICCLREEAESSAEILEEKRCCLAELQEKHSHIHNTLALEFQREKQVNNEMQDTEQLVLKLEEETKEREVFSARDRHMHHVQQLAHEDFDYLEGYSQVHSALMFDKIDTLKVWHELAQDYIEETACLTDSQQKAKQAFTVAAAKYQRLRTNRDQLSSELTNLQEESERELHAATIEDQAERQQDQQIVAKYKDHLQRCLITRDLKYETVLESKDFLVASVKELVQGLYDRHMVLDAAGMDTLTTYETLLELGETRRFTRDSTKLLAAMPTEADYIDHLERIQKVLQEYISCMKEIDNRREDLLRERAALLGVAEYGLAAAENEDGLPENFCACPCPSE